MRDDQTIVRNVPALYALKNKDTGIVFNITKNTTIGRQADCDIELVKGHVSRLHASLRVAGVALMLKDENSSNGTFVNGTQVTEIVLNDGDLVKFDIHEFTVLSLAGRETATSLANTLPPGSVNEDVAATLVMPAIKEEHIATLPPISQAAAPKKEEAASTLINETPPASLEANERAGRPAPTRPPKARSKADPDATVLMDALSDEDDYETDFVDQPAEYPDDSEYEAETTKLYGYHSLVFDEVYALDKDVILVGKSPLADIVVKDASVSSSHAELVWENGYWAVHDLDSTNGTFLNGVLLNEPADLIPGDLIQFGLIQIVFGQPEPHAYLASSNKMKWVVGAGVGLVLAAAAAYYLLK